MKSASEDLEELMKNLSAKDVRLLLDNRFPYIFTKAHYFLQDGPELYKKKDAFSLPDNSFSKIDIEKITIGCKQILTGKGFRKDLPMEGIGIRAFYKLLELFHFEMINQLAYKIDTDKRLNKITFKHVKNNSKIVCYNVV
jgi:hypothetical protein